MNLPPVPLTAVGRLDPCVLLTYRTPAERVARLLPPGLTLTTRGPWAFWNIVLCRVRAIRLAGAPAALGIDYHHVAYRLMVHALADNAERLHGLYFVRSDADHRFITALGNRMSDFRFHLSRITLDADDQRVDLTIDGDVASRVTVSDAGAAALTRPTGSCFPTPLDAAEFCCYRPRALAVHGGHAVLTEVRRDPAAWHETPVSVSDAHWGLFDQLDQRDAALEWAVRVDPVDYRWTLGRRRRLMPASIRAATPPRLRHAV